MVSDSLVQKMNILYMGGFGVTLLLAPSIYGSQGGPAVYWSGNAIAASTATDWFARAFGGCLLSLCVAENETARASSTKFGLAVTLPLAVMGIFNAEADSTMFTAQAVVGTCMLGLNLL